MNINEEKDIVNKYIDDKMTITEIMLLYHIGRLKIKKILDKYGQPRRNNIRDFPNENYFKIIDTEEKAYFCGYLLADGCISDKHKTKPGARWRKRLTLNLQNKDDYILHKLKEELCSSKKIVYHKKRETCVFAVTSDLICNDLIKLGIKPRKSLNAKFNINQIPKNLLHHFIRGLFDGDGCITHYMGKSSFIRKDGCRGSNFHYSFDICGSLSVCKMVKEILKDIVSDLDKEKRPLPLGKIYRIYFKRKESIKNIYLYMYKDATIFLKRKKIKFEEIFNYYNLKIG